MSQFKVGQRVKKIRHRSPDEPFYRRGAKPTPIGSEGVVMGFDRDGEVLVRYDNLPSPSQSRCWAAIPSMLTPLTDPQADAFMERLKKLGREPVNSPEKVTV